MKQTHTHTHTRPRATACRCLQASTGLSLRATAGLRLLPGQQADDILAAVRRFLGGYPFVLRGGGDAAVGIMDGAHEGAYAWLTLNYLLGRLGRGHEATVAAIDLGGGSVQVRGGRRCSAMRCIAHCVACEALT